MQKMLVPALCAVFAGLFICSCSEFVPPNRVKVQGTLDLPVKIGAANLNTLLAREITAAFVSDVHEDTMVYKVDYKGQKVQTFCIYFPIEMTEDLNPSNFLKTIDRQINDGIHEEPKRIDTSIPNTGPIPVSIISSAMGDNIPPVSLANIAQYTITIDFDGYNGIDESAGIGLNFYFTEIIDGLRMSVLCDELNFSTAPKRLKKGNNVFGNEGPLQLKLYEGYKSNTKQLNFSMILESDGPDPDILDLTGRPGYHIGDELKIEGEMRFFRVWTQASIDLAAAIKSSSKVDDFTGRFPKAAYNLSGLKKILDGKFIFNNLEVKLYMEGPDPNSINALESRLVLEAQYGDGKKNLYNDALLVSQDQLKIEDYLDKNEFYKHRHLPGEASEYDEKIDNNTIADIFQTMPENLYFLYSMVVDDDKVLIVYPHSFDNDSGDSTITTTMMIMLPMSLIAEGENDNKSKFLIPDMFSEGDLFGREEEGNPFGLVDVKYMKMTIGFSSVIFTKGHLFINADKDIFPNGVRTNSRIMAFRLADAEFKRIREKLIFPDIRVELDKGGTVNIPKNTGIVDMKFEVKTVIDPGDFLE